MRMLQLQCFTYLVFIINHIETKTMLDALFVYNLSFIMNCAIEHGKQIVGNGQSLSNARDITE